MGGEGSGEGRCGLGNPEGRELGARAGGRRGGGEGERNWPFKALSELATGSKRQ